MTKTKKRARVLALLLAAVMLLGLLASCGDGADNDQPSQTPGQTPSDTPNGGDEPGGGDELGRQTIKIGIATCFTGSGARGAETQLYGLQVALQQIESSGYSKY